MAHYYMQNIENIIHLYKLGLAQLFSLQFEQVAFKNHFEKIQGKPF